eukprot:1161900-Pelagomonas_calceolata.AAC.8
MLGSRQCSVMGRAPAMRAGAVPRAAMGRWVEPWLCAVQGMGSSKCGSSRKQWVFVPEGHSGLSTLPLWRIKGVQHCLDELDVHWSQRESSWPGNRASGALPLLQRARCHLLLLPSPLTSFRPNKGLDHPVNATQNAFVRTRPPPRPPPASQEGHGVQGGQGPALQQEHGGPEAHAGRRGQALHRCGRHHRPQGVCWFRGRGEQPAGICQKQVAVLRICPSEGTHQCKWKS